MMKRVLLSIGLLLLVILVLGFIAPKEYMIIRSTSIDASRSVVYEYIKSLEDLHAWTNEMFQDSMLHVTYAGTPGTVGSSAHWTRKLSMEEGKEEVMRVVPLNHMETRLRTIRPWESLSHSYFTISGEGEQSQLEWRFEGHSPFPFNIRHLFIDMDHIQGEIHKACLERLKKLAEKDQTRHRLGLKMETYPQTSYHIRRIRVPFTVLPESTIFDGSTRDAIKESLEAAGIPRVFIFESSDQDSLQLGVEQKVDSSANSLDYESFMLESSAVLTATHTGVYQGMAELREAVEAYIASEGWQYKWPIEFEYTINPMNERDTSKWVTLIHYRIRND